MYGTYKRRYLRTCCARVKKVLFENTLRLNCRPKEMPSTDQIPDFTLDVRTISELPSNISTMEKSMTEETELCPTKRMDIRKDN